MLLAHHYIVTGVTPGETPVFASYSGPSNTGYNSVDTGHGPLANAVQMKCKLMYGEVDSVGRESMSTEQPLVVSRKRDVEPSQYHSPNFSLERWGDKHQVLPEFIPFSFRKANPLTFVQTARIATESAPPTARTVKVRNLRDHIGDEEFYPIYIDAAMKFFGAWPLDETNHCGRQLYVNPDYVHIDTLDDRHRLTNRDERLDALFEMSRFGSVSQQDLASWFGINRKSVERFVYNTDVSWAGLRRDGKRRRARTWKLLHEWGYSQAELAEVFGYAEATISSQISKHVPSDWTVPSDPSQKKGVSSASATAD